MENIPLWVIKRVYKRKKEKGKKKIDKQLIGLIYVIDKSQDLREKIPGYKVWIYNERLKDILSVGTVPIQ